MEKTTMDFNSVDSSIYCCFSFLDLPLVMSDVDPSDLRQPAPRLPGIYYLWLSSVCCLEGSVLPEQDGCCHMGDDSAPRSWWLLSQFSPQSLCPQSLLRLLQPTLPPDFARALVSGCRLKFVHWPFKQLFAPPAVHHWQRATLLLFTTGWYLCTFWALVF